MALLYVGLGTTLIVGPPADVKALWAKVPGSEPAEKILGAGYDGFYLYPCLCPFSVLLTERLPNSTDSLHIHEYPQVRVPLRLRSTLAARRSPFHYQP